jgi:type I site-specific restriction endonuclease
VLGLLKQDIDEADARLKVEPMPYIDRDYQRSAILAVEKGLEEGKRELLVAMATGTGKTRTCIGLCYRLLKTKRCRRVLFLVDRSALGKQTADALKELRLENLQTFTDIFNVKELGDLKPDSETKLHIATIQDRAGGRGLEGRGLASGGSARAQLGRAQRRASRGQQHELAAPARVSSGASCRRRTARF